MKEQRIQAQLSRAMRLLPYVLLGFGFLTTFLLWWSARESIQLNEALEFERRKDQAMILVQRRIEEQVTLLRATGAAIAIDPELSSAKFHSFVQTLGLGRNYPGLLGVGYAYRVNRKDLATFESDMRAQGLRGYTVKPKEFVGEQFPIRYLEPMSKANRKAIGYNMFSEPIRRRAMESARDSTQPTASGRVVLVQDEGDLRQSGFLVYVPIYDSVYVPKSLEERRSHLIGFAYSPIRAKEFFGTVFSQPEAPHIGIEIHSGGIDGEQNLLFADRPSSFGNRPIVHGDVDTMDLAGMKWAYRFFAPTYASAGAGLLPGMVLAGVLITLMVFSAARKQVFESDRAHRQAAEANRRAERERFLSDAGRILSSSLDSGSTLDQVAALAVPIFAEWAAVDVPGPNGSPERISVHHVDPERTAYAYELVKRYPSDPDSPRGVARVLRTGQPEYMHEIPKELLQNAARDDEHLRIIESLSLKSYICVPLNSRGETLGAITFVSSDPSKLYDEEDFKLAQEIAARAAVALDNARLYEAAQKEISERKRAESQIRDLNANLERIVEERTRELQAANRELEAFCYSVSHDLRTPLRSVDGFSKALIEDYGQELPAEALGYLERVRKASHRMDELITALLTLSRITRAEIVREEVNLSEIAESSASEAVRVQPRANLRLKIQPGMTAEADARMVRIVYDNLIANALKFSSQSDPQVVEVGKSDGVFFVRDNGVGFNPEYKSKLFAPFERLHSPSEYPGTGVGLATVQRVVHKLGGEIWAESQVGQGATFSFTLA